MKVDSEPLVAPFTGTVGLTAPMTDHEPLDFFNVLFDKQMWERLVQETNRYVADKTIMLKKFSRLHKWVDVTVDEMKVFFALVIAMGITRKPDISDYWSDEPCMETSFFRQRMPRDRFLIILSNLHLVDNSKKDDDRLFKLRPFIRMLQDNFDLYKPERDLALDEGTCPFKGRVSFKVYNPAKPNKWGVKLYQVCESSSGYCVGFDIYDGTHGVGLISEAVGTSDDAAVTTKLVVGLLTSCGTLNKGHRVFLDNYYNSSELCDELVEHDTYVCGTVRINRKQMPVAFKKVKKLKAGEAIYRRRDNILALKYHDKRDIHMVSTFHMAKFSVLSKNDKDGSPLTKPTCIVDYIKKMGGVDVCDQVLQYYDVLRKTVKWWRKVFLHLFNLLIGNAFKLYEKYGTPSASRAHVRFRMDLVKALIESAPNAPIPSNKRGGKHVEPIGRLVGRHFPEYIVAKPGSKRAKPQRDCIACNVSAKQRIGHKRQQSSYICDTCGVALCVPKCFKVYHTHKDYKAALRGAPTPNVNDSDSSD